MPEYNARFSRKPFAKGGSSRFSSGPKTLYKANCAKCSEVCEVPFRPNGKKPVYCSNCFVKDEGYAPRPAYPAKREFSPRPSFDKPPREDRSLAEVKRELQGVNEKLERLISLMTPAPTPVKKAAKKAVAKKNK
ncbi:MAG TPA: CxxC-x17-CxxC domain-containing protein [Candidatus Paceibacterota bacterium]|nr:CxxC-x17-CxxC domain-containing protein [Candidatus Paceibacterota bacterium]